MYMWGSTLKGLSMNRKHHKYIIHPIHAWLKLHVERVDDPRVGIIDVSYTGLMILKMEFLKIPIQIGSRVISLTKLRMNIKFD